jgi:hypothetical protein
MFVQTLTDRQRPYLYQSFYVGINVAGNELGLLTNPAETEGALLYREYISPDWDTSVHRRATDA